MPNYRTHSIHGCLIIPQADKQTEIDYEAFKKSCMGPDALIASDNKTFNTQHESNVRDFFLTLIDMIKEKKLAENPEVMAFLYGQIDHYILDLETHPLIYYMTEGVNIEYKFWDLHGLLENWIDDFAIEKYKTSDIVTDVDDVLYYKNLFIKDKDLRKMVNELYEKVYFSKNEAMKYDLGLFLTNMLDVLGRRNKALIWPLVSFALHTGNVSYGQNAEKAKPYLNLDHEKWYNPETGEELTASFEDLWKKSDEKFLETIEDVNNYIYKDKELKNPIILNDISYNTGIPCSQGQHFQYIKTKLK